ncbi:MAG: hypothetical protein EZS28_002826, partial [Streblomastix strix]
LADPVTFLARVRKTYEGRNKQDDLDAYLLITLALIQHLQFTNKGSLNIDSYQKSSSSSSAMQKDFMGPTVNLEGRELADELLREVQDLVEDRIGIVDPVEDPVVGMLFLVLAEKAQLQNDYMGFYSNMLGYLSRVPLESIKFETQREIATSLAISALVSPDIFTFGELVSHPVLQSLKDQSISSTPTTSPIDSRQLDKLQTLSVSQQTQIPNQQSLQWLYDLVAIFDEASPQKYTEFVAANVEQMKLNPTLVVHSDQLKNKIRVASFVSAVFAKQGISAVTQSDQQVKEMEKDLDQKEGKGDENEKERTGSKTISFEEIAQITQMDENAVEFLVLKAFAAGLVTGRIDEVSRVVRIEYVKPRLLSKFHIAQLYRKVEEWGKNMKDAERFLHSQINREK